ncbi:MAG: PIN domain-containing protein [Candidatus Thiodiazotropha sp. (ex Ctena orbiculata)]|uniref:PIN domain-containing protein n=1 Tax=Candidatus Thiodiazotropha taylori TaxID=2792791 RepID=A0A944QTK3_9GAMM|nr:PIN domain-containing protein [Candidatus Thiodiazotropha taylori]MBV2138798.1 PIN domain-containing protein [Candidatus Thiodiazotropha taylori]
MANFTVIYDACVLYPAPLRDLLVRLALTKHFRARWTNKIHEEWIEALLKKSDELSRERLEQTAKKMNDAVPDCLVDGYESFIEGLSLPDPDDRHVLAAAIRAGAEVIVTMNQKDFPEAELNKYDIFCLHPDDFIMDIVDLHPATVTSVVKQQRANLKNPPYSAEEFIEVIRRQGLPATASFLESEISLI